MRSATLYIHRTLIRRADCHQPEKASQTGVSWFGSPRGKAYAYTDTWRLIEDVQYVIYLGTNDKDTNEPVFSPEESMEKAKEILLEYFGGYTIQEAQGGWIGEDGTIYQEYTLVIYLSDTNKDQVHKAADEMLDTFHQGSVLIQTIPTQTEFYYYQAADEADETEEAELDAAA